MPTDLLSFAGWYFLPQLVTGWAQTAYYSVWIRAGEPKPQPGSRQYAIHRKRIHILVIVAYLLYTIYEADWQLRRAGDFYQDLGVSHGIDVKGLQSRFRRLTVQYHPDKVSGSEARSAVEAHYVHLKLCRDTLLDPAKRFAYDRFGPDMLKWRHCTTIRDFVVTGVQSIAVYYAGTASVLVLLGIVGYLHQAPYWRYWALASLFMFELHTMTRPTFPALTTKLIDPLVTLVGNHAPLLPFQTLTLARKIVVTFFIALSQIGPLLQGPQSMAAGQAGKEVGVQQLNRLDALANTADQEVTRLLGLELTPFAGDQTSMQELRGAMRSWLVDNTVRSNPSVRDAIGRVMERRRMGVPAGARGAS